MSEEYFKGVGSQTRRNGFPRSVMGKGSRKESYVPRCAITWTQEISNEMMAFFNECDYPFRLIEEIPFKDPLKSEIRRFFLSLDAYIESPNPVIPYKDILYGSTKENYAETLKRIKRKSFETSWNVEHFAYPDWWGEIPSYRINDIGDIFNYSYLPFFNQTTDDYKYGYEPLSYSKGFESKFKDSLREILPSRDRFEKIEKYEIQSQISSSKSLCPRSKKSVPHYKIKDSNLGFNKTRGCCKRITIPVSPNNIRDSVLNSPQDLNTISLMDQQLLEMLRVMPGHIHLRDKDEVTRRLKHLYDKHTYFIQRDIKKEGITKPRFILKWMLEVLHEEYPDIEIFGFTTFYDTFELIVNDKIEYPPRGVGLGMANSLTTLMQLTIHHLIMDELINDIPDIQGDCLCINDDFTVGIGDDRYHVDSYWDKEDEVLQKLGILRAPDKSFLSIHCFVLAERYITRFGEYPKISYQTRELLMPLACYNIVQAKEYFISAQAFCNQELATRYIGEMITYWGYEFFPEEFNYPYVVGGWINEKLDGVDLGLLCLDKLDFGPRVCRGFKAARVSVEKKKKWGDLYIPPILKIFAIDVVEERYRTVFDQLHASQLDEKYGVILSKDITAFKKYWDRLERKRKKEFSKEFSVPYEELIRLIVNDHPTIQYYPNEVMISGFDKDFEFYQGHVRDIYMDPNPKMSYLSKHHDYIDYPFKEEFSINFVKSDSLTKKSSSLYSKEIQRMLKSEVLAPLLTGHSDEFMIASDSYRAEEDYLNPFRVGAVSATLNPGYGYPKLKPEFRSPIIKLKREVYGKIFSMKEHITLSASNLTRDCIKEIAQYHLRTGEPINEIIDYLADNVQFDESSSSESEDSEIECEEPNDVQVLTPTSETVKVITLPDLIEEGSYYIYMMRQNREEYPPHDTYVRSISGELITAITAFTSPYVSQNERERIYNRLINHDDKLVGILSHSTGVLTLYRKTLEPEEEPSDDEGGNLFGDDW